MMKKYKKLIITVAIIIIAFFLYGRFFTSEDTSDGLLSSSQSTNPETSAEVLGADIIRAINQIDSLNLDRSVFDNVVLQKLIDRSEIIEPENPGKENPFAAISFSVQTPSESSEDTQGEVSEENTDEEVVEGQN
jgi:hypothetical protein